MTYFKKQDYEKSLDLYNKALNINPEYADAYINRSIVCASLGNYEQVTNDIKKMFSMDIFRNDYLSTFEQIKEILLEENSEKSLEFLKEINVLEKEIPDRFPKKTTV